MQIRFQGLVELVMKNSRNTDGKIKTSLEGEINNHTFAALALGAK